MNKNVRVRIKGLHSNADESSDIGIDVKGTYYYKDGRHYVCFDEVSQDGRDKSKSILKMKPDMIELIKRGQGATHLYFETGKLNNTYYNTFMGNIFIGVDTRYMELNVTEQSIMARIEYELVMNEIKTADCTVEIEVIPE